MLAVREDLRPVDEDVPHSGGQLVGLGEGGVVPEETRGKNLVNLADRISASVGFLWQSSAADSRLLSSGEKNVAATATTRVIVELCHRDEE